jgi:hypothetical protein
LWYYKCTLLVQFTEMSSGDGHFSVIRVMLAKRHRNAPKKRTPSIPHKNCSFINFRYTTSSEKITILPLINYSSCDWKPYCLFGSLDP